MNTNIIIWFLIAIIASVSPVPFTKSYIKDKHIKWVFASMISFLVLTYAYIKIFSQENISIAYPLVKISAILIVAIIGFFLFNEKINLYSSLGIFFGILSIYLLSQNLNTIKQN